MKMRKGTKTIIWTGSAIICALLIAALIMGLISVRPLDRFKDYNSVEVINGYGEGYYSTPDRDKLIEDAFKTVKFSVLRATLEGQFGYEIKPTTYKNSDGDTVRRKRNQDWLKNLEPVNGEFMLLLSWNEKNPQTDPLFTTDEVDVLENGQVVTKSVPIVFNRLIIMIPERNGEVQTVKLYPYFTKNIDNGNKYSPEYNDNGEINSESYYIYEFTAKMQTSKLYDMFIDSGEFTPGAVTSTPVDEHTDDDGHDH